jgi:uncharacterized protein
MKKSRPARKPLFEVRHSRIHGNGVFALRKIRKGTRVMEYLGDRVSHDEADSRHEDKDPNDNHTFLFTVDRRTVIDGGVNGNDARFINHSCDPNCESLITDRRVFIEAVRMVQPGEELAYDYLIQRDSDDEPDVDVIFACHCGAASCRGSMLEPAKRPSRAARARRAKATSAKSLPAKAGPVRARRPPAKRRKTKKKAAKKRQRRQQGRSKAR